MDLDGTGLDRQLARLESDYRAASLRLDLARLEYFQLRRDAGDPAQIASAEEKVQQLTRQRNALRHELERLEDLH
jgi:predicted  nucleic acid-binding Zn-ribbon protein